MAERGIHVTIVENENVLIDLKLESRSVLVGSGAHCDVRLGPEQLASEQLSIFEHEGQLYLDVRAARPLVLVDGQPFSRGPLLTGQRVTAGSLQIFANRLASDQDDKPKADPVRRVLQVVLVLVLVLVGGMMLTPDDGLKQAPKVEASPFGSVKDRSTECPESSREAAMAAAREIALSAKDRRERGPFDPRDAVEAVHLFAVLGNCLQIAGDGETAKEATAISEDLRDDIESRFHVHRVRLQHALSTNNMEAALAEVRILSNYLNGQEGEYVAWLDYVDRKLKSKQPKKKVKK